jgi:hypothetical protein
MQRHRGGGRAQVFLDNKFIANKKSRRIDEVG